jgi:hypothetical protein
MISFTCGCGKQLESREIYAGQWIECPACGAKLTVPDPYDPPRSERRPKRRDDAEAPAGSKTGLIVGGIIAGALALGAVVTVVIILAGKSDSNGSDRPLSRGEEGRTRALSQNNLHQIGIAMHNYNDTFRRFPPAVVYNQKGEPLYSWRVLLLPYLDQNHIYNQVHFNEAWDSPHNKSLLTQMPKVYAHPGSTSTTETHYLVFDGRDEKSVSAAFASSPQYAPLRQFNGVPPQTGQVFEAGIQTGIPQTFTDGASNTILVVEADKAVPWSKPEDLPFGPGSTLPPLGGLYESGNFQVCLADGSVRTLNRQRISDTTLRAAITANGGEVLGNDW